jgi:hypothetical protein
LQEFHLAQMVQLVQVIQMQEVVLITTTIGQAVAVAEPLEQELGQLTWLIPLEHLQLLFLQVQVGVRLVELAEGERVFPGLLQQSLQQMP